MRFDWYSATLKIKPTDAIDMLMSGFDMASISPAKPRHGYERGYEVKRGEQVCATLLYGGIAQGDSPHVIASGIVAPELVKVIRQDKVEHLVTRADVCEDYDDEGAWDVLSHLGISIADEFELKTSTVGDWLRGVDGRTLYVGSRKSVGFTRIYEKGKQLPELNRPHLVRVEHEIKPKRLDAKWLAATAQPHELVGFAAGTAAIHRALTGDEVKLVKAGTVWTPSDDDRAFSWMIAQYGSLMSRIKDDLGSWECLGKTIGDAISEREERLRKP